MADDRTTRRTILSIATTGVGAAVAATVVGPAVMYAFDPLLRRDRTAKWEKLGNVESFDVGRMHEAVVEVELPFSENAKMVFVWRPNTDTFVVFSRACTDLGCPLTWDRGSQCFYCPCHGGIFAQNGDRLAGPPSRPLWRYEHRIRDSLLEIDLHSVPPMV